MSNSDTNSQKNKTHYQEKYARYNSRNILHWLKDLDGFLQASTSTETSWFAMYKGDFRHRIQGKRVVEMGCGDCTNAAVMAALGAEVWANDIAPASGRIIAALNEHYPFTYPIRFVEGDFMNNNLPSGSFDFVIGKAFLHHLELPTETAFLKESSRLLCASGEARFFEPAVNNKFLDELRWHVPVKGRPSKFNRSAFSQWKAQDPHPDRSFSSAHFEAAGKEFFKKVDIIPVGTLERFSRLMKWGQARNTFKRWALQMENKLPEFLNRTFTRSQLIIYREPVKKEGGPNN